MEAWFDTQDLVTEGKGDLKFVQKNVLFFHLRTPSAAGGNAIPFEFDGPATQDHVKRYNAELRKFLMGGELPRVVASQLQVIEAQPLQALPQTDDKKVLPPPSQEVALEHNQVSIEGQTVRQGVAPSVPVQEGKQIEGEQVINGMRAIAEEVEQEKEG